MVEIDVPIEGVESWDPGSGGKLTPGIYEVEIVSVESKQSSTGHPKLSMKAKVVAGDCIGSTCFVDRSLHPNALGFFRGLCDMLNLYATGTQFDEQKFVGRFLRVQLIPHFKEDGTETVKSDKLFRSEINDGRNLETDMTASSTSARPAAPAKLPVAKPAAARPASRPAPPALPSAGARPTNGKVPAGPSTGAKDSEDDLPF